MGRDEIAQKARVTQGLLGPTTDAESGTRVLQRADDLAAARARLEGIFRSESDDLGLKTLRHPGGSLEATLYWSEQHRLWAFFPPLRGERKYLNLFGLDNPREVSRLAIAAQANPPSRGESRSAQGVFVREGKGGVALLHRGRFTIGNRGVTKRQCLKAYEGETLLLNGDPVLVVARLDEPDVVGQCAQWVRAVAEMKVALRGS